LSRDIGIRVEEMRRERSVQLNPRFDTLIEVCEEIVGIKNNYLPGRLKARLLSALSEAAK
jgi:hypothetical protein